MVEAVETALSKRWQELHDAAGFAEPSFRLLDGDFQQLVRRSELVFAPGHGEKPRPARLLSDGQRSLLHLALTATILDVEGQIAGQQLTDAFALSAARLPNLTLIAVEEPENSLSPFFLSRIVAQLHDLSGNADSQTILSSHSASAMARIDPEAVRYFRLAPETATASVREITLPDDDTEAGKFLREAVHAYPELYFAKFVVLGEGDTEQLVIPRVARALGVSLDPSFVVVVPLGGRHTNHMWRLLNDLRIPHATLLDLDFGKGGGGAGRLKDAFTRLADNGIDATAGLDGFTGPDAFANTSNPNDLGAVVTHLRKFGIFFSGPLDLDYAMLTRFPEAYKTLEEWEQGPRSTEALESVFGKGEEPAIAYWHDAERAELLRWFRFLFSSRSKPSSHLRALGRLSDEQIREKVPRVIADLVEHIKEKVGL
ncbi:ATP-dependent nuclease [Lentzea sp. CA-135723]|uniref:ATP-dependent nuclease n=1 Tax=Lentzea sp. CA-135723 TaxID=3239950 RepID=UPI003D9070A6